MALAMARQLQFGRALSGAETSWASDANQNSFKLQFGRALSGAETHHLPLGDDR